MGNEHGVTPYRVLSGSHGIVHAAVVGRKEWFLRNPYDPADHLAQDYRLWVRACRRDDLSIGFIGQPLYYYREMGSVDPAKVLAGKRVQRRTVRENGRTMVGLPRATRIFVVSVLKSIVTRFAAPVGLSKHIVRARSRNVDVDVLDAVLADIKRLKDVPVPRDRGRSDSC